MRPIAAGIAIGAIAVAALAQDPWRCGTSDETIRRARDLDSWASARLQQPFAAAASIPNVEVRGGTLVMPADALTAPLMHTFHLTGRSLLFRRKDAQNWSVTKLPLQYDTDVGALLQTQEGGGTYATHSLTKFSFPFFDRTATKVYVSSRVAVFLDPPLDPAFAQYDDLESAAERTAVIAPMLMTPAAQSFGGHPEIHLKEDSAALKVTWTTQGSNTSIYDVQAALFANGDIEFSYRTSSYVYGPALIITSGTEWWRTLSTPLLTINDRVADVTTAPADIAPMLDLTTVTVSRVSDLDLLEVRLETAGDIDRSKAVDKPVSYRVLIGNAPSPIFIDLLLGSKPADDRLTTPWTTTRGSSAVRVEKNTITFDIPQMLFPAATEMPFSVQTSIPVIADVAAGVLRLPAATNHVQTDFAKATQPLETNGPLIDAFTLPNLNVAGVWNELKSAMHASDNDIDALAIYYTFPTYLPFTGAGAYSTVGNPGADGIALSRPISSKLPRVPALLHMNPIYPSLPPDKYSSRVVLHEFGHHWLYFPLIVDGGQTSAVLSPGGSHPAAYVDTRAPFQVYGPDDSSVMGGGTFQDDGHGSFTTPSRLTYWSYSAHELYLMGLMDRSEVPPFFWIAGTSLPTDGVAAPSTKVQGARRDVTIDQIIAAMGPRVPSFPNTQRLFRMWFVLLTDPEAGATDDDVARINTLRAMVEHDFASATGGRASLTTTFYPVAGPRHRPVGH